MKLSFSFQHIKTALTPLFSSYQRVHLKGFIVSRYLPEIVYLDQIDPQTPPPSLSQLVCTISIGELVEDAALVTRFLRSYDGSSATFNAYRRDIERLCQWAWLIQASSICTFSREDIEQYIRFTLKPPKAWVGVKNISRFVNRDGERRPNPDWRPFVAAVSKEAFNAGTTPNIINYAPSHAATKATFTALSSF